MGDQQLQKKKGRVCVTGGTGHLGSWLVKSLLEDGYTVNATIRFDPEQKRDLSYLKNLAGASERLHLFNADLENPKSFTAAIEGCIGLFHLAHPIDAFEEKEPVDVITGRVVNAVNVILQACIDSKTVQRVVYTSSISTVAFNALGIKDENSWTDVDLVRHSNSYGGPYTVTKTLTEKAVQEFAENNGLDVVTVIPTMVTGPFICPHIPFTVRVSLALIFGEKKHYGLLKDSTWVHVDDVVRAHIFLFEYPKAKGRYICPGVELTIDNLFEFMRRRYPEFSMPNPDSWKDGAATTLSGFQTKRILEAGFKIENGLEEMFDGAIQSCKQKDLL